MPTLQPLDMPLQFGIFLPPMHKTGVNPTLAIQRDLELVTLLDGLGYAEAWIGEHHSAGSELIASPEVFIAAAAERTKHIKLGTGVNSLPYHHPLVLADRIVMLDHLTRGRMMFGAGPGQLTSDAAMLGIDPKTTRARMDESLGVIMRLFTEVEPFSHESDWFVLRQARLQMRPFSYPHMPVAVTAVGSPAGMQAAGKYGTGVLSFGLPRASREFWGIAEDMADKHGKSVDRSNWRLVIPVHLAETRKDAWAQAGEGAVAFQAGYREETLGIPRGFEGKREDVAKEMVARKAWCIGTPDDLIALIRDLQERSGGFGGFMVQPVDWATREQILRSHELLARYVMPVFQGSLDGLAASQADVAAQSQAHQELRRQATEKAEQDYLASKR
ncbi:MAG: LLM class flavin-dependent oxidoreductase [Acidimicrobiia bacterium]|nr:LLM class flavin-dependent oxidoreductase [Acidimicrobiia bacterium]